jgi:uncharacterized lipoprotein YddW (UPF0748 family)
MALAVPCAAQNPMPFATLPAQPILASPLPPFVPFPHLSEPALDHAGNGIGVSQAVARQAKAQARILWVDATANLDQINSRAKVERLVERIAAAGFNTVVVDVKPISGHVLYASRIAPKLSEWRGKSLPSDVDVLAEFIRAGKRRGLQVIASLNAFSEGHRERNEGPGFEKPEWQTTLYEVETRLRSSVPGSVAFPISDRVNTPVPDGQRIAVYSDLHRLVPESDAVAALTDLAGRVVALVDGPDVPAAAEANPRVKAAFVGEGPAGAFLRQFARAGTQLGLDAQPVFTPIGRSRDPQVPLMMNPHHPDVRQRMIEIVKEVAGNYELDGIIFDDRLRYAGLNADFGEETRRQFEAAVGGPVRWPDDVFRTQFDFPTMARRTVAGPRYDAWLAFRARALRDWVADAAAAAKAARPSVTVAAYVGSTYFEYPLLGANWAADDVAAPYRFLTPAYQKAGLAPVLDWITTGCYYTAATVAEPAVGRTPGATVEAAGQLSNRLVNDQAWVYAGISVSRFLRQPEGLKNALQAAAASTQGVMVFDLSHLGESHWRILADAFRERTTAPHASAALREKVKQDLALRREANVIDPPIVLRGGAVPGVGM